MWRVEVCQRASGIVDGELKTRSLGVFSDEMRGEQIIYDAKRDVWKRIHEAGFVPDEWITEELKNQIIMIGFETWSINDKNSDSPLFFIAGNQPV